MAVVCKSRVILGGGTLLDGRRIRGSRTITSPYAQAIPGVCWAVTYIPIPGHRANSNRAA